MALEAVGGGTGDGTVVTIGRSVNASNQKWVVVPKGNDLYAIRPSYSNTLVLAASKGGTQNGTQIVLETDKGTPWQLWSLRKNENGTYCLIPKHAPDKGLDDFGGRTEPGSRQDLWQNTPGDTHLQWLVKPLAGTPIPSQSTEHSLPEYVAPNIKPEAILPGQIKTFNFAQSRIFPGTVREVTVFIPAQYNGERPACVYVKTDGYNPREKELLERMIATQEMPVLIGVFVRPGDTPANVKNAMGRRNRDLEYDGMGDRNVRFLDEELLPYIAREFHLNLSTNGNDRCISGGSSGGIAAFTAAWERPESFSRVYANSGSFVAFRGGHEYPTMVRKFEAKPIRAYLTTGTHDMENAAGDWFLLDQEMDKALRFSGYDYLFRSINGGHVAGYYEYWQEAMSYLWRGWPQPVHAGTSAPRVRDVILPEQSWQPVSTGTLAGSRHNFSGATCNANGDLFFIDTGANKICRIDARDNGKIREFVADAGHANSLTCGPQGEIYAVSRSSGKIVCYDLNGKPTPVAEGVPGEYILAMPNGSLYVTVNGTSAPKTKPGGQSLSSNGSNGQVWLINFKKEGNKRQEVEKKMVASGLKFASGLAYRPDQWLLAVAEGHSRWGMSYQIQPDGSLLHGERYFWLHVADWDDDAGTEQACYAREGQLLFATRWGIQICADDGPTQVILPLPDQGRVYSVAFGGQDLDTLYAFSDGKIWRRRVKIHGMGAFTPWTRVNGTPL